MGFRQRRVIGNPTPVSRPTDDVLACPRKAGEAGLTAQIGCLPFYSAGHWPMLPNQSCARLQLYLPGDWQSSVNHALPTKQARARLRVVHTLVRYAQEMHMIDSAVCRHDAAYFRLKMLSTLT